MLLNLWKCYQVKHCRFIPLIQSKQLSEWSQKFWPLPIWVINVWINFFRTTQWVSRQVWRLQQKLASNQPTTSNLSIFSLLSCTYNIVVVFRNDSPKLQDQNHLNNDNKVCRIKEKYTFLCIFSETCIQVESENLFRIIWNILINVHNVQPIYIKLNKDNFNFEWIKKNSHVYFRILKPT